VPRLAAWATVVFACASAAGADVHLRGRVVDENGAAVTGARVSLLAASGDGERWQATADPTGRFNFDPLLPGDYFLTVELQGYFRVENRSVSLAGPSEITVVLSPAREVFEKVDVSYSPPDIDLDRTAPEERLTGTQILEVPYPSTNTLRNAMRALPGIVQDSAGGIHLNGGTEEQVLYTLDGFEVNDPLTGRFDTRLSTEAVRSLDVTPLNPAEFGKGASGVLAIKTSTGDDKVRYSGTNFIPGLENRKGWLIGGWTPRFNLSGPILRGRAWFSDGLDIQFDQNVVEQLPRGEDRTRSWRVNNLLRNQVNLTPANIVYTSFLTSFWLAPHWGLGVLDPIETTTNHRSRQWFINAKDQWAFSRGALLEAGFAVNRTFEREIPQGPGLLYYTPEGRSGTAFLDATRNAGRDEFLANIFVPSFTWAGVHQIKTGIDLDWLDYTQDASRTGYVFLRSNGLPSRSVRFGGSGDLHLSNAEQSAYVQDSWRMRPSILLDVGLRAERDRLLGNMAAAPRLGISWAPPGLEGTKISAGYGIVYEESNLLLFSRPLDEYPLTTHFGSDGAVAWGPAATIFLIGPAHLKTPRSANFVAAIEHRFASDLYARFQYTRRRLSNGLTYVNMLVPGGPYQPPVSAAAYGATMFDGVYRLTNARSDVYDAFEITLRRTFRKQYEWLATYSRSRALSNAVVDVTADEPILVSQNVGRMPWDAPNRLMSWGYLPTLWEKWAIAYLVETRNGFPFSIVDEQGLVQGDPNRFRFPAFFELNLHLERRFVFRHNQWAFRFGFNNITNHRNPNVVNNDTSSPNFMQYYGGQSRALNFRLRWLGKS